MPRTPPRTSLQTSHCLAPHIVWLALIALTLAAFLVQTDLVPALRRPAMAHYVGTAILAIAWLKVRLIGLHYMELAETVWPLRLAFEIWAAALALALAVMFAMA